MHTLGPIDILQGYDDSKASTAATVPAAIFFDAAISFACSLRCVGQALFGNDSARVSVEAIAHAES